MANVKKGNVWSIDTLGVIIDHPIWIKAITFIPNAAADAMRLDWWDEQTPITNSERALTATVTSTAIFTDDDGSHNWLSAAAFPALSVVKIIGTSGLAANKIYDLISVAGDNDHFHGVSLANETSVNYHIAAYQNYTAFQFLAQATTNKMEHITFPHGGIELPNLTLAVATTAGSTKALLYLA